MRAERATTRDDFPTTLWVHMERPASPDSAKALADLLPRYRSAMVAHLVRFRRVPMDVAEDVVQSFIAERFLEKSLWEKADRARGRFRNLVRVALDRHYISRFVRPKREQEAASPELLGAAESEPSPPFDVQWARALLHLAIDAMRADCERRGKPDVWGTFEGRVLKPIYDGTPPEDYEQLAARYSLPSVTQAANLLVTAKRTFRRHVYAAVRPYATSEGEVEQEVRDLQEILAGRCAESDPETRIE